MSAHYPAAHHAFGILHRNAALAAFHQHDERHHRDHHGDQQQQLQGVPFVSHEGVRVDVAQGVRQPHYDAREDDQRHAVAYAAFADLLAEPHDKGCAGSQRNDGKDYEAEARTDDDAFPHGLQATGNGGRLDDRKDNGQVAGPLGDLTTAQFALFLQLFQGGNHHREQLQNDGRRDVRHDAQGENRQAADIAAGEHVEETEERARRGVEKFRPPRGIDPRRGDVPAQPVHRQQGQREQQTLAKIRDAKDVGERFQKPHGSLRFPAATRRPSRSPAPFRRPSEFFPGPTSKNGGLPP